MPLNGRLKSAVAGVEVFFDIPLGQYSCLICWTPTETSAETCLVHSATGKVCTREPGHDGPHAACGPRLIDHPLEIWEN